METNTEIAAALAQAQLAAARLETLEAAGIKLERTARAVYLRGNTYPVKGVLARLGFRWTKVHSAWVFTHKAGGFASEPAWLEAVCATLEDAA